jgi:hypothetical protein
MTASKCSGTRNGTEAEVPATLAEYVDRLLLGTSLGAADAVLIASGRREHSPELRGCADALRAGWTAEDLA